jgi:nucleoside-diphosphate-sugar epimerase
LLILGYGYSARRIARDVRGLVTETIGTVRSPQSSDGDIRLLPYDGEAASPELADVFSRASHLLVSIPAGEGGDPFLRHNVPLLSGAPKLRWIGYLSTVGVYGNYGGAWVSERTTPHARQARSTRRLESEKAWQKLADERQTPLAIFRIAGIYGPGRNALKNLADGTARRIVKPDQVFNRIHVDDIGATLAAAVEKDAAGIFNLADDEPCPPQDVVEFAANLMGAPVPPEIPFENADLSPMARSFYGENKRVSNRRIKDELGVALRYPTYREGLESLWTGGGWRPA